MFSLAALRYRHVSAALGGPVAKIEACEFPIRGERMILANATLAEGLIHKRPNVLYSNAHGTGVHPSASVARHMAVSKALERWAFFATVRSPRAAEFGFNLDASTTGMSAFPGLFRRQARRGAVREAAERFSLIAWWDGLAEGQLRPTGWPDISALEIASPFGLTTVVVFARTTEDGYVYGHAAGDSFLEACQRAVLELVRHESVLRTWQLKAAAEKNSPAEGLFDRRALFFSTEEGFEIFQARVQRRATGRVPAPEVICDAEIPGPWSRYATVWRFAFRPLSTGYREGERYFFL